MSQSSFQPVPKYLECVSIWHAFGEPTLCFLGVSKQSHCPNPLHKFIYISFCFGNNVLSSNSQIYSSLTHIQGNIMSWKEHKGQVKLETIAISNLSFLMYLTSTFFKSC